MSLSADATELILWGDNDAAVYRQYVAIAQNMQRKLASGTYNHTQAVKGWRHWADSASKSYDKEFGYGFPVAVRNEAAAEQARRFEVESRIQTGGLHRTTVRGKTRLAPKSGTWMFS